MLIHLLLNWMIFGLWLQIEGVGSTSCWPREREALLQFHKAATLTESFIPPYIFLDTFNTSWFEWDDEVADCCKWQGVKCDQHSGRVIELRLPTCQGPSKLGNPTPGLLPMHCFYMCSSLPSTLSRLEALQVLDLRGGCFLADIPPAIFESLTNLTHLDLSNNFLYPPAHLPLLPNLAYFNFSSNILYLKGGLPGFNLSDLARSLPNLRYLDLSNSQVFDPAILPSMIESFHVAPNYIEPAKFSANPFPHLIHLDISGNLLYGVVPSQLGTLQNLTYLNLASNRFQNPLPWPSLANLSQLQHLKLGNIAIDDVEVLTWEASQTPDRPCKWQALGWLSCENMRFASDNSTLFCLEQPEIISKLTYLSFSSHHGSIAPLLHSLSSANTSLHLQSLMLPGASLGEIIEAGHSPAWLSPLDTPFLESLDVSLNALTSLPAWFPQLPRLQSLDISNNNLTEFPSRLQKLPFLKTLDISRNHVNVSLQQLELHKFAQLQSLTLSNNAIKGTIPPSFLLPSLSVLDLSSNHLEGGIPFSIGNLSALSHLDLSNNHLTGSIPPSIGMSKALSHLDLSYNMLFGELPRSVANLTALTELDFSHNNLLGSIPPRIFDLRLSSLDLSFNNLTGSLPLSLQNCGALKTLDLSNNYLSGRLPHLFDNCPVLSTIKLANNSLSGDLPQTYQNCKLLSMVDLSSNNLTGSIPEELFINCSYLIFVNLGQNSLSSEIPTTVGKLVRIQVLVLDKNGLSKEIPRALQNCTSLVVLDLSYNQLSGSIPEWLSGTNFKGMVVMMLSNNELQGPIPFSLMANSTSLQIIGLANNRLSGSIPTHLDQLVGMTNAVGSDNVFLYSFTLDIAYKGTDRSLNGYILSATVALDLSNNNLEGPIPAQLGALRGLTLLNLSHNALTGPIPSTLGGLSESLASLDLSHNQLDGGIPSKFCSLDGLGALDLSSNHLQGSIPTCPRLSNFDASCFAHNDGLCGSPLPDQCAEAPAAAAAQAVQESHRTWFGKVQDFMSLAGLGLGYAVGLLLTSWFLNR